MLAQRGLPATARLGFWTHALPPFFILALVTRKPSQVRGAHGRLGPPGTLAGAASEIYIWGAAGTRGGGGGSIGVKVVMSPKRL